jgi:tRNA(Ile)-lysidine synthase
MFEAFQHYIKTQDLFSGQDPILLTVSGGMDSVVMLALFCRLKNDVSDFKNIQLGIAHCNFNLRGEEADDDVLFVEGLATQNNIPFFKKNFETQTYAREEKISIQMAARQLRYEWFQTLQIKEGFQYVATAHHQNDVIETVLINLIKGTGIAGLHGIAPKSGHLLRPLLFATREEIRIYANEGNLSFREDSSNNSTKYIRNKIRKEIIPVLKEMNPKLEKTLHENTERITAVEAIYRHYIAEQKHLLFLERDGQIHISIPKLKALPEAPTVLYELLKPYLFKTSIVKDICSGWDGLSGKQYFSPSHRLLKDREQLIVIPIKNLENEIYTIETHQKFIEGPISLVFNKEKRVDSDTLKTNEKTALLDFDKLVFPLILRRWQPGDSFQPLGMQHKKKISDYLIDKKANRIEKENTWILISDVDIVWLVGHRPDERYKVTEQTENLLRIQLKS